MTDTNGKMTVRDLKADSQVPAIEVTVVAKEPARFIRGDDYRGLRSVAVGRDVTGEVRLTLWGLEASEVELGDRIRITNGFCSVWQGDRVLSCGRFGSLQIVD